MKKIIDSLPAQIRQAINITCGTVQRKTGYTRVLICGMGGSGISGRISQALFPDIDIIANSDYEIPHTIDRRTLAILISYSGNTEETLANFRQCARKNLDRIIISSDGRLLKQKALIKIQVPSGFPPRGALGYLFTPVPIILHAAGFLKKNPEKDLRVLARFLERERSGIIGRARRIASKIINRLPLIYVNSSRYVPVARRWQCQFNENAKILAHINVIPEMNHNEIVGLGYPTPVRRHSTVLMLYDPDAHARNTVRARMLPRVVHKDMPRLIAIKPPGMKVLHHMFWTIWLGDYISYYYATGSGIDPLPVKRIDRLKQLLAKN